MCHNKISEEAFYNKKVNLKYIKDCIEYYKNYSKDKGKFESNANKGIFFGFDEQSYSYLIIIIKIIKYNISEKFSILKMNQLIYIIF